MISLKWAESKLRSSISIYRKRLSSKNRSLIDERREFKRNRVLLSILRDISMTPWEVS